MSIVLIPGKRLRRRMLNVVISSILVLLMFGVPGSRETLMAVLLENDGAIRLGNPNRPEMALAVNVAWGEDVLPGMLRVLADNKVKATFFLEGRWAEHHPELVKKIALAGHEIGNHTYSHPHVQQLSRQAHQEEIRHAAEVIKLITGKRPHLYAPPYGETSREIVDAAAELGYPTILWTMDTVDWQRPGTPQIIERIVSRACNGGIALMHPVDQTVSALPSMISELRAKGFRLVCVSELLKE